jgi:hypothetical protein
LSFSLLIFKLLGFHLAIVDRGRIVLVFQTLGVLTELCDSERCAFGASEFVDTFRNGDIGDLGDVDDLTHGTLEVVHASGEDNTRAAESRWVTTSSNPVALHPTNDLDGIFRDLVGSRTEFESPAVFENQVFDVHHMLKVQVAFADVQLLAHGLVNFTESENIDFDHFSDVDQEDFIVRAPTTRSIKTSANNLRKCTSSGEIVVGSHAPNGHGLRDDLSIGDGNSRIYALQFLLTSATDFLNVIAFAAAHTPEGIGVNGVGVAGVLANEAALHGGGTARGFLKGDIGDDISFGDLGKTVGANFGAITVLDVGLVTTFGDGL